MTGMGSGWLTSTYSAGGNCVQAQRTGDAVAVRDSKHPAVELPVTRAGWARLLEDLRGSR